MSETFSIRPLLLAPASSAPQAYELTPSQLDLVWDLNRFLTRREFDQFIETSKALGLNPLKRQICAILLGGRKNGDRQISIVTTISGLRAIADRTGTYRPDTRPARITISGDAVDPRANPLGIVDCVVTLYRFAHGRWHKVVGQVWWDEIAPIWRDEEGVAYLHTGTPWPGRPRGQIIKCAEAAALRAGWPENLANVYVEDEMDRTRSTAAPSDIANDSKKSRLLEQALPKGSILADLWDDKGLSAVPIDKFHDRVSELIRAHTKAGKIEELLAWRIQQRVALRAFFAHDKNAALDIKRQFEEIEARCGTEVRETADGI